MNNSCQLGREDSPASLHFPRSYYCTSFFPSLFVFCPHPSLYYFWVSIFISLPFLISSLTLSLWNYHTLSSMSVFLFLRFYHLVPQLYVSYESTAPHRHHHHHLHHPFLPPPSILYYFLFFFPGDGGCIRCLILRGDERDTLTQPQKNLPQVGPERGGADRGGRCHTHFIFTMRTHDAITRYGPAITHIPRRQCVRHL